MRASAVQTPEFPLADVLAAGVAAVGEDGRQTYVNEAFAEMVGWPAADLIGASAPFVYWPPEEMERIQAAFQQTVGDTAHAHTFELRFQRRDGQRFDALVSVSRLPAGGRLAGWAAAVFDVSRQKHAEAALHDREQRLSLAMSAGRLGSWEYDLRTGRVIWSVTLERIHGLEPGTFGGTFEDYQRDIHPDDLSYVLSTIARSSHGDAPHQLEYRIIWPNGEVRWLQASGKLFRDADGHPIRMLGVCTDITEHKTAVQLTQAARDEAERANRAKSEFLAAMSHELRTPLNAIGGYLDLLDLGIHGPVTDHQREAFASIKRNQNHLLVVINDLLNFAQLEAGQLDYEIEAVEVAEFLAQIEPMLEPHAAARNVLFAMERAPAGLRAYADPDRLHQVLLNLVSNATKFTPPGGNIRIWCESNQHVVALRVRDTGRGIPADKLAAIFDPFVQVDRKNSPATEKGVGLGLAISRDLARGMGGDLKVISEPGRGSTFTLELRRAH